MFPLPVLSAQLNQLSLTIIILWNTTLNTTILANILPVVYTGRKGGGRGCVVFPIFVSLFRWSWISFCLCIFCCIETAFVGRVYKAGDFALIFLGSASWRWLLSRQHAHVAYSVLCLLPVHTGCHSSRRRLKENQSHYWIPKTVGCLSLASSFVCMHWCGCDLWPWCTCSCERFDTSMS